MTERHSMRSERGQTMVEFALVAPVLLLVLFGVIQFGILYRDYVTITDAARVGARTAAVSRHQADPVATTLAKVRAAADDLDQADLQVAVSASGWNPGDDVTVQASYPYRVSLLGFVVKSGRLQTQTTERVE